MSLRDRCRIRLDQREDLIVHLTARLTSVRPIASLTLAAAVLLTPLAVTSSQAATAPEPLQAASGAESTKAKPNKPGKPGKKGTKTTRVRVLPLSGPDIANPLRGQYRWMGYGLQPETEAQASTGDVYYRDQMYWGRIEPADDQFDFSVIDAGLADAEKRGVRFNFRVMSYCPGCWMNDRPGWAPVAPPFLPQTAPGIPDWNSPTFVAEWEELMAELGRRYGNNPRIGIVDVGGYGKYGEYWTDWQEGRISVANSQRVVGAVVNAFPKAHVVMNTMDRTLVEPAVAKYPTLGLRTDCLGAYNMFSIIPNVPELQEVYKRAPVVSEWCHNAEGSTTLGAEQVRQYGISMVSSQNFRIGFDQMTAEEQAGWLAANKSAGYRYAVSKVTTPKKVVRGTKTKVTATWRNDGSAPTYDRWRTRLGLRDATGAVVWQSRWNVPLKEFLPGSTKVTRKVRLPKSLPAGRYTLVTTVESSVPGFAAMNLANAARGADGWYDLARVRVK